MIVRLNIKKPPISSIAFIRVIQIRSLLIFIFVILFHSVYANDPIKDKLCKAIETSIDYNLANSVVLPIDSFYITLEKIINTDCPCIPLAYTYLGFIKITSREFTQAKEYLLACEEYHLRSQSSDKYIVMNQLFLGLINCENGDFELAEYQINKGTKIAESLNDSTYMAWCLFYTALLDISRNKTSLSEAPLKKMLTLVPQNFSMTGLGYLFLARINFIQKNPTQALKYLKQAKEALIKGKDFSGLYHAIHTESSYYLQIEDCEKSLDILKEGKKILLSVEQEGFNQVSYFELESKIHDCFNNPEKEIESLYNLLESCSAEDARSFNFGISRLTNNRKVDQNKLNEILIANIQKLKIDKKKDSFRDIKLRELFEESLQEKNILASSYSNVRKSGKKKNIFIALLTGLVGIFSFLFFRLYQKNKIIKSLNSNLSLSQEAIKKQVILLESQNKDLEQFAYVASHDLKSPLRTISSFSSMMEKGITDKKQLEYLTFIKGAAQSMSSMITDLLNHATAIQTINIQKVSFTDLLLSVTNNLRTKIETNQVTINTDNLNADTVFCDQIKMAQVLQNIISNAVDYAKPEQSVTIAITSFKEEQWFKFNITDDGIGINEKYQARIFDMFYRIQDKKDVKGNGIGLATCKKIIGLHDGKIALTSKEGMGTTFEISLPNKV